MAETIIFYKIKLSNWYGKNGNLWKEENEEIYKRFKNIFIAKF